MSFIFFELPALTNLTLPNDSRVPNADCKEILLGILKGWRLWINRAKVGALEFRLRIAPGCNVQENELRDGASGVQKNRRV